MPTNQPKWKLLANLGDASPIDYGGYFIWQDETGVYAPEGEILESPDSDTGTWRVYRFALDKCTITNGVLSDNKYHPEHAAWFDSHLASVADSIGMKLAELRKGFCSEDPLQRAHSYRAIGEHCGLENLDSYPLSFTKRDHVEKRYGPALRGLKRRKVTA